MSALPTGWAEVELGEVWRESRARVRPAAIGPTKYIGLEHVASGTNRITGHRCSEGVKSTVAAFSSGDVLYGRLRPYLNKVVRPHESGVGSTEFLVFKESSALANALLMHLLSSSDLVAYASANSAGVNLPRVSAQRLGKYRFGLAPLPEQRRIVARIESLFAELDEGVAALKRAEANLERYRASVLKSAVEGRLTEQWRKENPPEETGEQLLRRILAERRKRWEAEQLAKFEAQGRKPPRNWKAKYKEPVAPDASGLPELPEGWCWATVDQVSLTVQYGSSAKTSPEPEGVPVLRMGNIQQGALDLQDLKYLPFDHREFPKLLLRDGDLLFNRTNSAELVGKTAVYRGRPDPCSFASYLISVRILRARLSPVVANALNSSWGRAWIASVVSQQVGQANVNGTKLRGFPFPLPPEAELGEIIRRSDDASDAVMRSTGAIADLLHQTTALRQSILKRAFEGRLVPQDPTDEPASVLLERIRAERKSERKRRKRRPAKPRLQLKSRIP